MKKVADIGYKYVQVSAIGDVSAECIKRECEKNGLRVILTHWNPAKMRSDIDTVIRDHDIFGCDAIGLGGLYIYNEPGKPFDFGSYAKFKEEFAPIVAKIKAAGKKFVYHNHRFEFEKHNGKIDLVHLMDENPDVDLVFDTYWSQAGGYDPALFIRKYGDRIHTVHLKDMKIVADKQQFFGFGNRERLGVGLHVRQFKITVDALCDGMGGVDHPHTLHIPVLTPADDMPAA
jgi:sugar phosphate isomerase/epimerase